MIGQKPLLKLVSLFLLLSSLLFFDMFAFQAISLLIDFVGFSSFAIPVRRCRGLEKS